MSSTIIRTILAQALLVAAVAAQTGGGWDEFWAEEATQAEVESLAKDSVGFDTWPGGTAPMKAGYHLVPSTIPSLSGAQLVGSELDITMPVAGVVRELAFDVQGQDLSIYIGVGIGTPEDAHLLLLGHMMRGDQMAPNHRLKRGDIEQFALGEFNWIDAGADTQSGPPAGLRSCYFVRGNVAVALDIDAPVGNAPAADLASIAGEIDAQVSQLPDTTQMAAEFPTVVVVLDRPTLIREDKVAAGAPLHLGRAPQATMMVTATDPVNSGMTVFAASAEGATEVLATNDVTFVPVGSFSGTTVITISVVSDRLLKSQALVNVEVRRGIGPWITVLSATFASLDPVATGIDPSVLAEAQQMLADALADWDAGDLPATAAHIVELVERIEPGEPGIPTACPELADLRVELRELLIAVLGYSARDPDPQAFRTTPTAQLQALVDDHLGDHDHEDLLSWMDQIQSSIPLVAAQDQPPLDSTLLAEIQQDFGAARNTFDTGQHDEAMRQFLQLRRRILAREGGLPQVCSFLDQMVQELFLLAQEMSVRKGEESTDSPEIQLAAIATAVADLEQQHTGTGIGTHLAAALQEIIVAEQALTGAPPNDVAVSHLTSALGSLAYAVAEGLPQVDVQDEMEAIVVVSRQLATGDMFAAVETETSSTDLDSWLNELFDGDGDRAAGQLEDAQASYESLITLVP